MRYHLLWIALFCRLAAPAACVETADELIQRLAIPGNDARRYAVKALARMGDEAIPALREASASPNEMIRAGAVDAMGEMRSAKVFDAVAARLSDESWGVRLLAVRALRQTPDPRRVALLQKVAQEDDNDLIRNEAKEALGRLEDPSQVAVLTAQLEAGQTEDVRASAAEALKKRRDPSAVDALVGALARDPSWRVRGSAAQALGSFGDPRALQPLLQALDKDGDENVRGSAALGLFWMAREMPDAFRNQAVVDILLRALGQEDTVSSHEVVTILGVTGDAKAIEAALVVARRMKDPFVRLEIESALLELQGEEPAGSTDGL